MISATVVGSTGVVGSRILATLLDLPDVGIVTTFVRRGPISSEAKLNAVIEQASGQWSAKIAATSPSPSLYFSALGTTRAKAGGITNQRKIDVDLNYELAKAAREAGTKTCVLISASGADAQSMVPYSKMKGELEDMTKSLDFETLVVLRPGFILGDRPESRMAENAAKGIIGFMPNFVRDRLGQDKETIARAAVAAGLKAARGEVKDKIGEPEPETGIVDGALW